MTGLDFGLAELGWVDWSLLALIAVSMLVGLARGFVFEVVAGGLRRRVDPAHGRPQLAPQLRWASGRVLNLAVPSCCLCRRAAGWAGALLFG